MNKKHVCYEDNQGHCHNGCGRILNPDSARAYHGDEEYIKLLAQRNLELEAEVDMLKCAAFDQADKREKLEAERDRLREGIINHRAQFTKSTPVRAVDLELWAALEGE